MNAEKYVKDIVGRIKCSGAKKKEIEEQLMSDISMRMEQGEPLTQIMESMGTAQEIADAFMQDLPERERRAYRNKRVGLIVTAIVLGIVLLGVYVWWLFPKPYSIEDSELLSKEAVSARVEEMITLLDKNDFETLQEESVEEMHSVLTKEVIDQAKSPISEDWGERQAVGSTYMQGMKQRGRIFVVTQTDVMYENTSVTYTITFDENMKLAGVYMR